LTSRTMVTNMSILVIVTEIMIAKPRRSVRTAVTCYAHQKEHQHLLIRTIHNIDPDANIIAKETS